jgi:hypothetical protein
MLIGCSVAVGVGVIVAVAVGVAVAVVVALGLGLGELLAIGGLLTALSWLNVLSPGLGEQAAPSRSTNSRIKKVFWRSTRFVIKSTSNRFRNITRFPLLQIKVL